MRFKIILFAFIAISLGSCKNSGEAVVHDEHEKEEVKFRYSSYTNDYELFAEADPFIAGASANILSHFSLLPENTPVSSGKITIILSVNGKEYRQTLENPAKQGIYSFDLVPEAPGNGILKYEITDFKGTSVIEIPQVKVFSDVEQAHEAAEAQGGSKTNTSPFTKEQAWKVKMTTGFPQTGPFGQVIKTTGIVQASPSGEIIITSKTNGIITTGGTGTLEGSEVRSGQALFTISGSALAENNISVRYNEAKNNYDKAKADFERAKELSADRIISEKDFLSIKNQYDNASAVYENLSRNFSASGQKVTSPVNGYVRQVFVKNGSYVEAGQPLLTVSQNRNLVVTADVPQKYASILETIKSANIRNIPDGKTYSLDELNGKLISFGRAANNDNYLLPVNFQIENRYDFIPGSFVEIYLKSVSSDNALTVPNSAILEDQGIFFVYVQINPELFEKREVKTGATDGIRTQILDGITANDRIVTSGAVFIRLAQATGALDAHSGHVH